MVKLFILKREFISQTVDEGWYETARLQAIDIHVRVYPFYAIGYVFVEDSRRDLDIDHIQANLRCFLRQNLGKPQDGMLTNVADGQSLAVETTHKPNWTSMRV